MDMEKVIIMSIGITSLLLLVGLIITEPKRELEKGKYEGGIPEIWF